MCFAFLLWLDQCVEVLGRALLNRTFSETLANDREVRLVLLFVQTLIHVLNCIRSLLLLRLPSIRLNVLDLNWLDSDYGRFLHIASVRDDFTLALWGGSLFLMMLDNVFLVLSHERGNNSIVVTFVYFLLVCYIKRFQVCIRLFIVRINLLFGLFCTLFLL